LGSLSILIPICFIAVFSVNRLAITIGVLFTVAVSLGAYVALPPSRYSTSLQSFVFLLAVFGVPVMLITVPLTIHRLTGSPIRKQEK
jgi:hypothetical protein